MTRDTTSVHRFLTKTALTSTNILTRCNRRNLSQPQTENRFGAPLEGYLPASVRRVLFSFRTLSFRLPRKGTLPVIAFNKISLAHPFSVVKGVYQKSRKKTTKAALLRDPSKFTKVQTYRYKAGNTFLSGQSVSHGCRVR